MRILKSLLAGLLAGIVAGALAMMATAAIAVGLTRTARPAGITVADGVEVSSGLQLISINVIPTVILGAIAFVAAFAWQWRRTVARR